MPSVKTIFRTSAKTITRIILLVVILISIASNARAQFQTAPDAFDLIHSQAFSSGSVSVLDNDPRFPDRHDPTQRVLVRITKEPEHGQLVMNEDGTFTYTPTALYTGPDQFEYVIDHIPLQELTFNPAENSLNLDATVTVVLGTDSDDQDIPVNGTLWVDIGPTGDPLNMIQIADLDIKNNDAVNLNLDFGGLVPLGSLIIDAGADSMQFGLNVVGPTTETLGPPLNPFTQTGNKLGLEAVVQLQGTGLLAGQVPTDPQNLVTETDFDLTGLVFNNAGQVSVVLTVNSHNEFQLDGNDVVMDITGQISAIGPLRVGGTSNPEVVSLSVFSPTNIAEEETPSTLDLLSVYPNPTQNRATITYTLAKPTNVEVTVFDILGREIVTLAEGHQRAGETRLTWNAEDLPRGIYFLKVTTTGPTAGLTEIRTKAIVLQ